MKKSGFTLIELMVVISIIGILAGIALPRFMDLTASAKAAQIQGNLANIRTSIGMYHSKTGFYPAIDHNNRNQLGDVEDNGVKFTEFYSKSRMPNTPAFKKSMGQQIESNNNIATMVKRKDQRYFLNGGGWLMIVEKNEDNSTSYNGEVYANISTNPNYDPFGQGIDWAQY